MREYLYEKRKNFQFCLLLLKKNCKFAPQHKKNNYILFVGFFFSCP